MAIDRNQEYWISLVKELLKYPKETEWVEFKQNNEKPAEIGEQISALSNATALCKKTYGYLIWGVNNETHEIIGTTFAPTKAKVGNEELENWLLKLLEPKIHFQFIELKINDQSVVILEIPKAYRHPLRFSGEEYIRIGSYSKKIKGFPELEKKLWRIFDESPFEELIAAENLMSDEVLQRLDYPSYFELLNLPLPTNREQILEFLELDSLIQNTQANHWNITNLGAILLAKKLSDFKSLKRKAVRVILYRENNRNSPEKEQEDLRGYASGFKGLIEYIKNFLPSKEIIEHGLRKNILMFPEIAVRELVANALIHQDFFITGAGPMVEIFKDRIEITNPGKPLIEANRLLDSPPRSRNEALASFMRRVGICEERGSGVDKVVEQTELYQLPAPVFEIFEESTRVILFAHQSMKQMSKEDRIRACYLHASRKYVIREWMTNASLRVRFGIEKQNSAIASRIIKDTIEAKLIRLYDPEASRKYAKYVPYWVK